MATDALAAAAEAQLALCSHEWPTGAAVRVRMGIHTGEVRLSESEYVGMDVHRAARISAAAHGGQVLLSGVTRALVEPSLGTGLSIRDVGEHRLKDIDQPEHLYQLVIAGLVNEFPPPHALATRFDLLPAETSTFVGREDELRQAQDLLRGTRLLTLTGPGGTGKTRLAIQLARTVADDFADGVAFVPLAAISDPGLVPSTIRQRSDWPSSRPARPCRRSSTASRDARSCWCSTTSSRSWPRRRRWPSCSRRSPA